MLNMLYFSFAISEAKNIQFQVIFVYISCKHSKHPCAQIEKKIFQAQFILV